MVIVMKHAMYSIKNVFVVCFIIIIITMQYAMKGVANRSMG